MRFFLLLLLLAVGPLGCFTKLNVDPRMVDNAASRETERLKSPVDQGPRWFVDYTPTRLVKVTCPAFGKDITMQPFQITDRFIGQYAVTVAPAVITENPDLISEAGTMPVASCTGNAVFVFAKDPTDHRSAMAFNVACPDGTTCAWTTEGAWAPGKLK
jgi:hypothetical protein